jgi:hypothetical protein
VTEEKEAAEREETEWVLRLQSGGSDLLLHFIVLLLFVLFLFWFLLMVICGLLTIL